MNSLVVFEEELVDERTAELRGERAEYAYTTHELRIGASTKVSVWGGKRGVGEVTHASSDRVLVALSLDKPPLPSSRIEAIVGVSRPQTVRKIIQAASAFGIDTVHFLKTERTEKSYLSSKALEPEEIRFETVKSLEQVYDSRPPAIHVHRTFSWFVEKHLPEIIDRNPLRLIADTRESKDEVPTQGKDIPCVIAFGPELGWTDEESEVFRKTGFCSLSLGPRIVRVEHALVYMLGKLSVLRD